MKPLSDVNTSLTFYLSSNTHTHKNTETTVVVCVILLLHALLADGAYAVKK